MSTVSWKPRLARAKWVLGFGAQYQGPQNKKRNTQDDDDDDDDFCMQKTFACVVVVVRPRIIMDLIMFLQLRTGWYCCVTQNSVDETLMDENGITSFNRWKPEKAPKTLDEKSITSIHRWKPEKQHTLDENIITSINRWKPEKHQTLDENISTSINPLEKARK